MTDNGNAEIRSGSRNSTKHKACHAYPWAVVLRARAGPTTHPLVRIGLDQVKARAVGEAGERAGAAVDCIARTRQVTGQGECRKGRSKMYAPARDLFSTNQE
jgi:hypothetical protein